ncbi:MAG: N(4)-(beta-N-acetylglucosaminyl)-L-asparaginase [Candidatus Aminicenantes bacterium]|nr:N(4)-(beta-N-acetylglucosaminyl)-L-asparaginase [Candidatus Aminicenantes bacterium]
MSAKVTRRDFIKSSAGLAAVALTAGEPPLRAENAANSPRMVVVASDNGLQATAKAMSLLKAGADPLEAVVAGVNIVEEDPREMGVGYGGLPNEDGVVELDASVMYGPTHKAGAVAGLRNIKNPSRVARLVMERTDHVLLVGEGALKFAKAHGFQEENLLTDEAREIWLRWKENLSTTDNWFPPEKKKETLSSALLGATVTGTINCLARDARGDLAGVTSTSGLSFKLAGRVGDSPIIGAGLYIDNEIGAAGSTGRGEANLTTCASFNVVELMGRGLSPEEACLRVLEKIVRKTQLVPRLLDAEGRPAFGLSFYAINKNGFYGSASMWSGANYAVNDGRENKLLGAAFLYKKKKD